VNQTTNSIAQQERGHGLLSAPQLDHQTFGFLQDLMLDSSIEELWINQPGEVWFADQSGHHRILLDFSNSALMRLIDQLLRASGRRLDSSKPFVDATLFEGSRLHVVIPNVVREHPSLNIRKFRKTRLGLAQLVDNRSITPEQAQVLMQALDERKSIMFSGATHSGKTTLLTACLNEFGDHERLVSVEDTFELHCQVPDWVAMQTREEASSSAAVVDLRRLIRESLRMRPTRLAVGEVRGAEAAELLVALNSGVPAYFTIHANSADAALEKLIALSLNAGENISERFARASFEASTSIAVHCQREGSRRFISELVERG
jgi:pilus assembly protein CpaF